jgi:hypothetical protein
VATPPLTTTTTNLIKQQTYNNKQSDSLNDNHQIDKAILDKFVNNMII